MYYFLYIFFPCEMTSQGNTFLSNGTAVVYMSVISLGIKYLKTHDYKAEDKDLNYLSC